MSYSRIAASWTGLEIGMDLTDDPVCAAASDRAFQIVRRLVENKGQSKAQPRYTERSIVISLTIKLLVEAK